MFISLQQSSSTKEFNANSYATRKTISQGLLDVALLTANVNQLKQCIQNGISNQGIMIKISIGMILGSILLQIIVGTLCIYLGYGNIHNENRQKRMVFINNTVTYLTFLITVLNVIISGLGIGNSPPLSDNTTVI